MLRHPLIKELEERGYGDTEADKESLSFQIPVPLDTLMPSSKKRKRKSKIEEDPDWQEGDDEELISDDDYVEENIISVAPKKLKSLPSIKEEFKTEAKEKTPPGVADFQLSINNLISSIEERSKCVVKGQKVIDVNQKLVANKKSYTQIFEALQSTHPLYKSANACLENIEIAFSAIKKGNHHSLLPIVNPFLQATSTQLIAILEKLNKPWPSSESLPTIEPIPEKIKAARKRKSNIRLVRSKGVKASEKPRQKFSLFNTASIHATSASSSHSHSHSHASAPAPTPVAATMDVSLDYHEHFLVFQKYTAAVEQQKIAAQQYQKSTEAVMSASEEMKKVADRFMVSMQSRTTGLFDRRDLPDSQSLSMQPVSGLTR